MSTTEETEIAALRAKMEREEDIKRVVRLIANGGGRYMYLIETPFATFPKFVIGTTDAAFEDVRLKLRCGLIESAEEAWLRFIDPDGAAEENDAP